MPDLTAAEIEEIKFRNNLQRADAACATVAAYLRRQGWQAEVVPQGYVERHLFHDNGDVLVWTDDDPQRRHVEVKWRNLDFTCAEDFPFQTVNIDRANKPELASLYFSVNRQLTHALIVASADRKRWVREFTGDPKRGYRRYEVYRCDKADAEFVCLLEPAAQPENTFFGYCACGQPGLYWTPDEGWFCNDCRSWYTG
jgi:hypothetical protein